LTYSNNPAKSEEAAEEEPTGEADSEGETESGQSAHHTYP